MCETAKILNPDKRVISPDMDAGCSLADSAPHQKFRAWVDSHPDHTVITYINCSAKAKVASDIICTSSNAEKRLLLLRICLPKLFYQKIIDPGYWLL